MNTAALPTRAHPVTLIVWPNRDTMFVRSGAAVEVISHEGGSLA